MARGAVLCLVVAGEVALFGCRGQVLLPVGSGAGQPCPDLGCACGKPSDCAADYQCAGGTCQVATCSTYRLDGACPLGRQCSNGACITDAAAAVGPYCDCTPTQGCADGVCTDITAGNGCSTTRPYGLCPENSVCLGGTCVVLGPDTSCSPATPSGLCPQGTGCVSGVCIPIADQPCGPSRLTGLCELGLTCVPPGVCDVAPCGPTAPLGRCDAGTYCSSATHCLPFGACDTSTDCAQHYTCDAGWCARASCTADSDCFSSEHCSTTGVCLPLGACNAAGDCASGQICSTLGRCLPAGGCDTAADCPTGDRCGSTRTCLAAGQCATATDCPPGFDCTSQTCVVGGQTCTDNASTPGACPAGQTCCPEGERCSAGGSCIFDGQCVTDTDCLSPYFVCGAGYQCAPTQPCDAGCGSDVCSAAGGCMPPGRCAVDLDCPAGQTCNALFQCVPTSATCGSTTFGTTLVKPNMLIVLDKSGSMAYSFGTTTRWAAAKSAIGSVLASNSDRIRFGLTMFPATPPPGSTATCLPGAVDVPVGESTSPAILAALDANAPKGNTPTPATLRSIAASPGTFGVPDPSDPVVRGNFALLVTDGQANCLGTRSNADPGGANGAVDLLRQAGITTYVVGIAFNTVSADLNCNAVYGRTSRCGGAMSTGTCTGSGTTYTCTCSPSTYTATACYYEAGDATALTAAFDEIARAVASCSFVLSTQPPDLGKLYVYLRDATTGVETAVPADPTDGWTYTPAINQLQLNGSACAQITSGAASPVVKYGCATTG